MGTLAQVSSGPGLPRGRGSLPPDEVARAHRERLLRAMIAAVAELGYANVRIADVVARARVSRGSFYAQFDDKEACFLAAHAEGVALILSRLARWADATGEPADVVRGAIGDYLRLVAEEPEFAHCMLIELQATGAAGLQARLGAHRTIAEVLAAWHGRVRRQRPGWPEVPASRYPAAVGAVHDLVFAAFARDGRDVRGVADEAVDAVLTLLEIPRR